MGAGYYLKLIKLMFFDDLKGLPADPFLENSFVVVGLACAFLVLLFAIPLA